jgi:hypothetical protein
MSNAPRGASPAEFSHENPIDPIAGRIHLVRGQRIMLDADLAEWRAMYLQDAGTSQRRRLHSRPASTGLASPHCATLSLRRTITAIRYPATIRSPPAIQENQGEKSS